jgi:hypothetical protein
MTALSAYKPLTHLNFRKLPNAQNRRVFDFLESNSTLTKLSISHRSFTEEESMRFGEALRNHSSLLMLNIQKGSVVEDATMVAIGEALKANNGKGSALTTLCIRSDTESHHGPIAVFNALTCNTTLKKLVIPVGPRSMDALCALVQANTTLEELVLIRSFTDLEDIPEQAGAFSTSINQLFNAMCMNTSVKRLKMEHKCCDHQPVSDLVNMLRNNTALEEVDFLHGRFVYTNEQRAIVAKVFEEGQNTTIQRFVWPFFDDDRAKHEEFMTENYSEWFLEDAEDQEEVQEEEQGENELSIEDDLMFILSNH